MDTRFLLVPSALLFDKSWTASQKVIWMVNRIYPGATLQLIQAHTGLMRRTIRLGLDRLPEQFEVQPDGPGARVRLPVALVTDGRVGVQAKVLYGLLQTMPETLADTGVFTFPRLRSHTGLASNTLRLAVKDLVTSGWMVRSQKNRSSPIRFTLGSLELRHGRNELRAAQRRLKRADFKGEALMKEYLSLLIDSDRFTDNARPGSLANPLTGERLELDRFYLSGVGFEFHGDQHVGESELCSKEESDAQRLRDLIKGGLCVYQDIQLVVIYARDLSIKSILRKIGNRLPLRDLSGRGALIEWLENRTWVYLSNTPASVLLERT